MPITTLTDVVAIESASTPPLSNSTSTYSLIRDAAQSSPDDLALSFFLRPELHTHPVTWTYRTWLEDIHRTANMLRRLGLQADQVVAWMLPNLPEAHLAIWGGEAAGISFAINPLLEGPQVARLLNAARAKWLITTAPVPSPENWENLEKGLAEFPALAENIDGVLAVDPLRHRPGNPRGSASDRRAPGLPEQLAGIPVLDFHEELARENGANLDFAPPTGHDKASYFCTGGTTGSPKIVVHEHRNEVANVRQVHAVLDDIFRPDRTILTCLPLFHVNAQLGTGLAAFAAGAHVLLGPPAGYRTPNLLERFWEVVSHHRVTAFSAVPTIYASLLQVPTRGYDLSGLAYGLCGAAPMPVELLNKFEKIAGVRILEGYGLTESSAVASISPGKADPRPGSIGLRLPWQDMRVFKLDSDGQYQGEAGINEVGSIVLAGPNIFPGYLESAHNTSAWIELPDGRRYFNTGDLGKVDEHGYFWLTGRKKELIIRGGHNIDPRIIEEVLAAHPATAMSAAVGRPDPRVGEVPVAYVQLRDKHSVSEREFIEFVKERIPERAAIPQSVRIVKDLPLTAVGKMFKPALVLREVESVVRDEALSRGIELQFLKAEQDPQLGINLRYQVRDHHAEVMADFLGQYTFSSTREIR